MTDEADAIVVGSGIPRAQFERRRDEFLPRDLTLLHAAARYPMYRPETALGPWVTPFYRLARDRCVLF
jgi:hypothetical protein